MFPLYWTIFRSVLEQTNLDENSILFSVDLKRFLFPFRRERFVFQLALAPMIKWLTLPILGFFDISQTGHSEGLLDPPKSPEQ